MVSNQSQDSEFSSVIEQPSIHYLSWGLRLLSDVASHLQRCSRCYAIEEESEHMHGGWAIATPNGVARTSIVDHPLYIEITGDSTYFCLRCFDEIFGGPSARKAPSSFPPNGPNLRENLQTSNSQRFLTDKGKQVFNELKDIRLVAGLDDHRQNYVGTNYEMEAIIVQYHPSSFEVGLWSQKNDRVNILISVPNEYLNTLEHLKVIEEPRNEKATKLKVNESEFRSNENKKNIGTEGTSNGRKKGRPSGPTANGQRCSRINGRGWQCHKMTLPGYALCEYHLALARTRTIENKYK